MNVYGVAIILGILAFISLVGMGISVFVAVKMKRKLDRINLRDAGVGIELSNLYKATTFDATREVIGNLMDKWLGC